MKILKKNFGIIAILALVVFVSFVNFKPGTWLSGWDNLHPEFNFAINVKRSIYAVWQEYQGLGLLGGMGHASELPRQIFLRLASFIVPSHLLRYFFHFVMLFIGPLGVYFLLKDIVLRRFKDGQKQAACMVGSFLYLFNLATLQMFYLPFEPYSVHYAFLPWLFWANLNYLRRGDKKTFLLILLLNILAIPQGYIPTFFIVYFIALTLAFVVYYYQNKEAHKKIIIAFLILFLVNAFWLLPNLYFVVSDVGVNLSAKLNQMVNESKVLESKKYGSLRDSLILKGFLFEKAEIDSNGKLSFLMKDWVDYLKNPLILSTGYLIFVLGLGGGLFAFVKKVKPAILFLPPFIFALVILSSDTPTVSSLLELFYKFPLFSQIFRTSFTKLSILAVLTLSIFYSLSHILLQVNIKDRVLKFCLWLLFALLPIVFLFPSFQGNQFYEKVQIKIPKDYFQTIDFFQNQDKNTRIANFPQNSYYGWSLYRWLDPNDPGQSENYSGSGFLWYGIEQPILDRAFDVWSNKNENYYWEISYALYSQNQALFEKVLEKYQINWLLVDGNIINPSSPKALFKDELEEMIDASDKIFLKEQFGKIKIYQVQLETPVKDYVFLAQNMPQIEPVYNWNNYDQAYLENGNYFSNQLLAISNQQIYFPFRTLFTGRSQEDLEFSIEDGGDYLLFKKKIPAEFSQFQLIIPEGENKELVWVNPEDLSEIKYLQPVVNFNSQTIEVKVPKVGGLYSAEIEPAENLVNQTPVNCNQFSQGEVKNEIVENEFLRLSALDANNCSAVFWLEHLTHQQAYLITIDSRNLEGKSLLFWLENITNRKADIETYLPKNQNLNSSFFIQPPMKSDGLEYSLHFDNISIGRVESINDLGKITVNPIPFKFLTKIKLVPNNQGVDEMKLVSPLEVSHPNPSYYQVSINNLTGGQSSNQTLVLSQAYHDGWIAWEGRLFIGKKLEHVLVNNWQNGWIIPNNLTIEQPGNPTIYIFFWPQLLEYFGFLLLFGLLGFSLFILVKRKKPTSRNSEYPHPQVLYSG